MKKQPNVQQQQVIDQLENNILLFASAGTGKTFTVAKRIANILAQEKAKPEEVACLTFTMKACNELKEDIAACTDGEKGVQVNTIHGFCYKILAEENKRLGLQGERSICDEVDQEELLKSILSSRYAYWKAAYACKQEEIAFPDLEGCSLCRQTGDERLFWRFDDKLISDNGELFVGVQEESLTPAEILCPYCQTQTYIQDRKCENCGRELSFSLSKKTFEIFRKKSALRNLVSEIKHCREEENFYSEDEIADNQQAFDFIKREKSTRYQELISCYAPYIGYACDEEFSAAMDTFAGNLVAEYNEHLRLSGLLDFDDLIIKANAVLRSDEGGMYWTNAYKYIILDEMQDTSRLEFDLLKKLFVGSNVMLCGDFFQTIYGWRGSRPEEILEEYKRDFSPKIYMFSENYRATKTLSLASFGFLENSYPNFLTKYLPKDLHVHSAEEGEKILCYAFDNREEEAWQIYKYILRHKPDNPTELCIIARSNKYIAKLSDYFRQFDEQNKGKDGLRFFTVEGNFQFFKKPVVKDVLAVLRLLLNPFDRVSMERLTEKFVRQVGLRSIEKLRQYADIGLSITDFIRSETYLYGDPYFSLSEGYAQGNLIIYDTESTGLDLKKDEIVQLSAIKIDREGNIIDTLDILVEPTVPIAEEAQKTHGFSLEYIKSHGGITAREALLRFSEFVKDGVLIGHNNFGYDKPLLTRQLKENDLPPLAIRAEYDTLPIAKVFYPALKDYKLSTLCEYFSIVNECAHNALGDVQATGKCLVAMIKEKLLPTVTERRAVVEKYLDKFEKFYEFMQALHLRLENGEELAAFIIESLRLQKRYPNYGDMTAMRDLIESLEMPTEDRTAFLKEYLKDAALSGSQMDVFAQKLRRIPIITVHQAKGCEFDTVILAGADDSNFPSFAAKQSGGEEEEKKVFYVAITRAKKRLIMTRALHDGRHALKETPYFAKIPKRCVRENRKWESKE